MPKLLIIDDELDIREFAKNFFRKREIDVATSDGSDALAVFEEFLPDLILLDIRLGETTGIDVLQGIRERSPDVPVIMVSGVTDEGVVGKVKQLGILGYIHKPLVLDELEKVVLGQLRRVE
jgi:DNA-binding response OmpR family regulator